MSLRPPKAGTIGRDGGARVAVVVVLALLAGSCRTGPSEMADPPPPPQTSAAEEPSGSPEEPDPPEPSPAPEEERIAVPRELRFTAPKLGGGQVRGAEYAGRDVALWFWAPW